MIVNISDAKAQLSKLVDMVYHGETVVIAKNNLPLVDLVPHKSQHTRRLGLLRGQIAIPDDFSAENAQLNEDFYGSNQ